MCSTHSSCSSAQFVEKKTEWKTDAFLTFIFSTQAWVSFNPFYGKSKIMKEVGVGKWWYGARLVILNLVPTGHQQKDCTRHGTNTNSTDPGAVMPSNGFRLQLEPFSMRGLFMQMFFFNVKHPKKDHCHLMDQFLTHIYVSPETSLQLSPFMFSSLRISDLLSARLCFTTDLKVAQKHILCHTDSTCSCCESSQV